MFLSRLIIDIGDNPDRPRPGQLWLRNLYHVHQRLCMAFPSASRKSDDRDFLMPYKPQDFAVGQIHVTRKVNTGFLFRIDPLPGSRVVILVQSALEPDWDYAFHNAGYLLAAKPEVKSFEPDFSEGQCLRYRLVANPTRRLSKNSPDAKEESIGKRVPVPTERLFDWLVRRAESGGFSILKDSTNIQPGYLYFKKPDKKRGDELGDERKNEKSRMRSVQFEGVLTVTDPAAFHKTIVSGIGSGKAFGFGLLSVTPVNIPFREASHES